MERIVDGDLEILVAGPAGFANNIYLVHDRSTGAAAFIDAPDEGESVAAVEVAGVQPAQILLTHAHRDHTAAIDQLKARYGMRLVASPREDWGLQPGQLDQPLEHGDEVRVGSLAFQVLGVPGHTPGSMAFVHGKHVFVGDTLFPGGPGNSRSNEALLQEILSITSRLYRLPDDTVVYPGHGARTTIGESKAEFVVFAGKPHAPDLHGDVLWLEH